MFHKLEKGLVVSCQALEGEPLHGGDTMLKMAKAAKEGGAVGIRTSGYCDIKQIKENLDLPVIGLIKKRYEPYEAYITPTKKEVDLTFWAGADIIAIDATLQTRPYPLDKLINYIKREYGKPILADISTFEEAENALSLGCDAVGITLSGYTEYTKDEDKPNFQLLKELASKMNVPVVAEGNISTPELAKRLWN